MKNGATFRGRYRSPPTSKPPATALYPLIPFHTTLQKQIKSRAVISGLNTDNYSANVVYIPFLKPNESPASTDRAADIVTLWALEERREEAGELLRGRGGEEGEEERGGDFLCDSLYIDPLIRGALTLPVLISLFSEALE